MFSLMNMQRKGNILLKKQRNLVFHTFTSYLAKYTDYKSVPALIMFYIMKISVCFANKPVNSLVHVLPSQDFYLM